MAKYFVSVPWHCSILVKVEADSVEEAMELAADEASMPSVCHQCSKTIELGEMNDDAFTEDCVTEDD